jgi:PAS domain S-box-containing protein
MTQHHIILEILKTIPGTLNVIDTDFNILMVGGEITRTFEDIEQVIGKKCHKVFQERDNPCPWCKVDRVIKAGDIINETTTPDDPREKLVGKPLNIYIRPLKDKDGSIIGAIELGTDITQIRKADKERKRAEEALRESQEKLTGIVESVTDAMIMMDKEFNVVWTNDIVKGLFEPDRVGNKCYAVYHGRASVCKPCIVQQCFQDSKIHEFETEITDADGKQKTLWCTANVAAWDEDGRPRMVVEFLRDITDRKLVNQKLREREAALEIQTNKLKEVNTALRVLLKRREEDMTELEERVLSNLRQMVIPHIEKLKKSGLDAAQIGYVNILQSSLNDIVSPFSHKLSSKYLSLSPREIQVANLVREGKTTKAIADLLNVSPNAVVYHRYHIRKKLGLRGKKINLAAYLSSLL